VKADKSPLRIKFGANSTHLATHTSPSPSPIHMLLQTDRRDGDFHRGATAFYVNELTLGPSLRSTRRLIPVGYSRCSDNDACVAFFFSPAQHSRPALELLISFAFPHAFPAIALSYFIVYVLPCLNCTALLCSRQQHRISLPFAVLELLLPSYTVR